MKQKITWLISNGYMVYLDKETKNNNIRHTYYYLISGNKYHFYHVKSSIDFKTKDVHVKDFPAIIVERNDYNKTLDEIVNDMMIMIDEGYKVSTNKKG